jgi:hypothetical protein
LNPVVSSFVGVNQPEPVMRVHAVRPRLLAAHDCEFAIDSRMPQAPDLDRATTDHPVLVKRGGQQ